MVWTGPVSDEKNLQYRDAYIQYGHICVYQILYYSVA